MSVINQMLKDLEDRRALGSAESESALSDLSWSSTASKKSPRRYGLWVIVFFIPFIFALFVIWQYAATWRTTFDLAWLFPQDTTIQHTTQKSVEINDEHLYQPRKTKIVTHKKLAEPIQQVEKIISHNTNVLLTAPEIGNNTSQNNSEITKTITSLNDDQTNTSRLQKTKRPLSTQQKANVAYKSGYNLLLKQQAKKAENQLHNALEFNPLHLQARELLAGIYIKAGRIVEARDLLQKGLQFSPKHVMFAKLYARILTEQKQLPQAIDILLDNPPALKTDPEYYALLAALYQRRGNHMQAAKTYNALLKQNSNVAAWWLGMAISLEVLDKNKEAHTAYGRAKANGGLNARLEQYANNRLAALNNTDFPD